MKRLSLYLFLIFFTFQTSSQANDIRDFQIEGISVGDSLLDYVTKDEIEKRKKYFYKSKEYATMSKGDSSFKVYEGFQVYFKDNDRKYIIQSLKGMMLYKNNIKDCYKKMDEIIKELTDFFKDVKKSDKETLDHTYDKSGKSKITFVDFIFKSGDYISVECTDWSKESPYTDKLSVKLMTKKLQDWLNKDKNY